jgi:hypothetical protein
MTETLMRGDIWTQTQICTERRLCEDREKTQINMMTAK